MGFFDKLKEGLTKTRTSIANGLDAVFGDYSEVDDDFFEELLDALVYADLGIDTAQSVVTELQKKTYDNHVKDPAKVKEMLKEELCGRVEPGENAYDFLTEKSVVLVIGVNGVGKTTTCGKLAYNLVQDGKKAVLCAADTFRAGAIEQLEVWAERSGAELVKQQEGSDPASVVYDGIAAMKSRNADVMLCDTAGRLHNKKNLMDELAKISRIIDRELPGVKKETFLVLDATTGQNALSQAKEFASVADLTGLILTKMDGTAKGGIAIAVADRLQIPVKYIGVGEQADDLQKFDAKAFLDAIIE